jgi:prepilin-type N-terminal cleavage/methylation domain-containing protein
MSRRGFTLIELLVATGVFVFGFSAAFAMFLTGTKYRAQADAILRLSLASSSMVEEIRLDAGRENTAPCKPQDYVGDGFVGATNTDATNPATDPSDADDKASAYTLYPYNGQPGAWYRVLSCLSETGKADDELATALDIDLLVVWNLNADDELTLGDLNQRLRLVASTSDSRTALLDKPWSQVVDQLVRRGLAVRQRVIVIRQPSWMKH